MIARAVSWIVATMVIGSVLALVALMAVLIAGNVVISQLDRVLP